MVFGCFDTMIVLLDGIVRRARWSSIYKKAPAHSDGSSILVGLLLEKSRLTRELFLSRAQFAVVVSYRQPESPQDYELSDIWNSEWAATPALITATGREPSRHLDLTHDEKFRSDSGHDVVSGYSPHLAARGKPYDSDGSVSPLPSQNTSGIAIEHPNSRHSGVRDRGS
jgi:hypothetical protein